MEDVLDLYEEPYDSKRPKVCFDETNKQLIQEKRLPLPATSGQAERYDYEYKRNGTRNLFMFCEPQAGWRHIEVTQRRTIPTSSGTLQDFARQLQWLVDVAYPDADIIRLVLDNLNTHKPASRYETFPPAEARRILKKLEFHYTPKHGSWLNMRAGPEGWNFVGTSPPCGAVLPKTAELELSVLSRQCLDRRIEDAAALKQEVAAYEHARNQTQAAINWRFTSQDARVKLQRLYPSLTG